MGNCIFCGKELVYSQHNDNTHFYECSSCGRFLLSEEILLNPSLSIKNMKSEFASYLYYNKVEDRCFFVGTNEGHSNYLRGNPESTSMLLTKEMVDAWYPKTFADKIDLILLKLQEKSKYDGAPISIDDDVLFLKNDNSSSKTLDEDIECQKNYIINFLTEEKYIETYFVFQYILTPKALERVYELQKNRSQSKKVFVAMKFGDETKALREKIREGLEEYDVRIMDEIEHNHQIVPEMLKEIKDSRFVVAELSHHNNGAYYEAGYALGLGKEVIHICAKSELKSGLHFDVAQVNTIVYDSIDDIPRLLKRRIEATIL